MLPLCTLALLCDLCDVETLAALGATSQLVKFVAKKELKKRARCAITHADKPELWRWGFLRMYRNTVTKQYIRQKQTGAVQNLPGPAAQWMCVPVLSFECKFCQDLHFMQRSGDWNVKGKIEDEGLKRNRNLDRFPNIQHPGATVLPRLISCLASKGLLPVLE